MRTIEELAEARYLLMHSLNLLILTGHIDTKEALVNMAYLYILEWIAGVGAYNNSIASLLDGIRETRNNLISQLSPETSDPRVEEMLQNVDLSSLEGDY